MSELEAIDQAILGIRTGQPHAISNLIGIAHGRLYDIAARVAPRRKRKGPTPTLHATALLNESTLRMYDPKLFEGITNADHFFAVFATATKHALIDHSRNRKAKKRGGGMTRLPLDIVLRQLQEEGIDIVELNDELEQLRSINPRCADVVEMFYFARMTVAEIAKSLNLSVSTIESELRFGRAFLGRNKQSE